MNAFARSGSPNMGPRRPWVRVGLSPGPAAFIAMKSHRTGMTLMPAAPALASMSSKSAKKRGSSPRVRLRLAASMVGWARPSPKTHRRTQLAPRDARSRNAASNLSPLYPCPHSQGPKSQP